MCYDAFGWTPDEVLSLPEPEALRLAAVFEQQAVEQYKQHKQQQKSQATASSNGFTEPGFDVEIAVGDEDDNDYMDSRLMTDEEEAEYERLHSSQKEP